jgi:hypothetical protein
MPVTGPIPGLLSTPNYRLASHRMRPGDKIAIITDGIDRQSSATADFPNRLFEGARPLTERAQGGSRRLAGKYARSDSQR